MEHRAGNFSIRPIRPIVYVIGPSIAYVDLTKGRYACIDIDDAERCGKHNWFAKAAPMEGGYYAVRSIRKRIGYAGQYCQPLHEFIAGKHEGFTQDHKSGETLDNRKANLRLANSSQQAMNRRRKSNNTSGFKGVNWQSGAWVARIGVGYQRKFLGSFSTPELAYAAYCAAAVEHFGEFAKIV